MSDTDYPTPITSSSSPPTTATAKITNANIARHSVSYNSKLLLKDNQIMNKKCSRCQQLGSFICEHSTKYRDELKQTLNETGFKLMDTIYCMQFK